MPFPLIAFGSAASGLRRTGNLLQEVFRHSSHLGKTHGPAVIRSPARDRVHQPPRRPDPRVGVRGLHPFHVEGEGFCLLPPLLGKGLHPAVEDSSEAFVLSHELDRFQDGLVRIGPGKVQPLGRIPADDAALVAFHGKGDHHRGGNKIQAIMVDLSVGLQYGFDLRHAALRPQGQTGGCLNTPAFRRAVFPFLHGKIVGAWHGAPEAGLRRPQVGVHRITVDTVEMGATALLAVERQKTAHHRIAIPQCGHRAVFNEGRVMLLSHDSFCHLPCFQVQGLRVCDLHLPTASHDHSLQVLGTHDSPKPSPACRMVFRKNNGQADAFFSGPSYGRDPHMGVPVRNSQLRTDGKRGLCRRLAPEMLRRLEEE